MLKKTSNKISPDADALVPHKDIPFVGLNEKEVAAKRKEFGANTLESGKRNHILASLWNIATEPMFILLAVACSLYLFLGDLTEAIMMIVSILFVAGIELYQETRSEKALDALRSYTRAKVRALRDNVWIEISSDDLVPDDIVMLEEGERVPADGVLLESHDFMVDESVLTGESLPVEKYAPSEHTEDNGGKSALLFQGTTITAGNAVFKVTHTGARTEFGKLGKSIDAIDASPTPLQLQTKKFVKIMGWVGAAVFAVVFVLNFWVENDVWKALLFSLTLAMAILPEEIPVAFSTFMGLGAFRMIKKGILAKQPKTVESLGSATVICLDKTGTITENKMSVAEICDISGRKKVLEMALWASEPDPFDAMEKAILIESKETLKLKDDPRSGFKLVKEYPLGGKPPMMTHIWENAAGERIVATKGGVERILLVSKTSETDKKAIYEEVERLASKGFRILGVASAVHKGDKFPAEQDDFDWQFEGLVALFDPPKKNVHLVFNKFYKAGIQVKMITGDYSETARNIARETGLKGWENTLTGNEVMDMQDYELQAVVQKTSVFARMFPDAKLRVVEALKANGETVAMSGDGVNDGPALKSAQIGVAMGKKGSDIAKSAASLVLLEDDLHAMVTAIAMGRRIYSNLKKAIRYVISIHIPIVLLVLIPLLLGWPFTHILYPLHVIFLELVMDPIAAIAFENEPAEKNQMKQPPRKGDIALFTRGELFVSILQGLGITLGVLAMYQYALHQGQPESGVRSFVFSTMVFANVLLTLANRSFTYTIAKTIFYKNKMFFIILSISLVMLFAIMYVPFLAELFKLKALSLPEVAICAGAALLSISWFEIWKAVKKGKS